MAKAAIFDSSLAADILPVGRCQSNLKMKRKTPSELRGEQLKRKNGVIHSDEKIAKMLLSESGADNELKKPEWIKAPRYIDTRVSEVYPVRKSSEIFRVLRGKDKIKDVASNIEISNGLDNPYVVENFPSENITSLSRCKVESSAKLESSESSSKASDDRGFRKIEKCSQSALRNVVEIHLGDAKPLDSTKVDIEKALKGLVVRDKSSIPGSFIGASSNKNDLPSAYVRKLSPEFHISGRRAPLDFTLKTTLRFISSSSVKWCHRVNATPAFFESEQHTYNYLSNTDQQTACKLGHGTPTEVMYSKAIQSWAFPQSLLPTSIIIAMTLSATKGETEFLSQRQQDWEDSFSNLYYMLRKNICSMFYVCTSQFVVLFIGNKSLGRRQSCSAFLSQSTRGLRSLLRNHNVCFSMPLCHLEVEHANEADLAELSEIEQQNLGKAFHQDSISGVDNSPQSLLAFIGNTNVHGLYDFLLNYRFFLKSLNGNDVPALYAPVPFLNASLCIPEVKCKEIKRADAVFDSDDHLSLSESPLCYNIEVKDTVLPPWVICRLCAAMSATGNTFESIFTTEPLSTGLNIALESFCQEKPDQLGIDDASMPESGDVLGLPEAAFVPCLQSASLRRLKYCEGSFIAYVNQI
ncbi:protein downstream neighbor of Son-like [Phalaenopsis equestris]|uniref:protein downstream neighbor of Son-like n=1 Tax=Phalaenopsis equestris TaxID=78828 RepID=UPI0009E51E5F|nr:protein downstream neighbor of Son-like [Phalaenopsis equestris]XP_020589084.1 protein downstream neighbor of Son-like [Phalaenopsis equestris]